MFVDYDKEIGPPRQHPWTGVENQPNAKYWDFRKHPEKISEVLEDFQPWEHYPAIQTFYKLLTWLNGPDSHFETNDCGMIPPKRDPKTPDVVRQVFSDDPIGIHGRVTVLYRNLALNSSRQHIDWLKQAIRDNLRAGVRNFPAVIFVGEWPHLFLGDAEDGHKDKEGYAVIVKFWAWGDDEALAMTNLDGAFSILLQLFEHLNRQIRASIDSAGT